jgi:predicted DNA-binding protein
MEATIILRVDKELKEKLQKKAKSKGRTLSNYLRWVLMKNV